MSSYCNVQRGGVRNRADSPMPKVLSLSPAIRRAVADELLRRGASFVRVRSAGAVPSSSAATRRPCWRICAMPPSLIAEENSVSAVGVLAVVLPLVIRDDDDLRVQPIEQLGAAAALAPRSVLARRARRLMSARYDEGLNRILPQGAFKIGEMVYLT